jgi:hypothetical protein
MTGFTDEMDKLAASIAKEAGNDAKAFGDKIDAFKALMPYYALQIKHGGGDDPESDDQPNFDDFTNKIHAVS